MTHTAQPKTWAKLAQILGYSPSAIRNWRKLSGSPKTKDVETWLAFVEEQALGVVGNRVGKDREYWLGRQAEFRARLLEIDHRRATGELVPRAEVEEWTLRAAMTAKRVLFNLLENELPTKAEGLTAAEIRVIARDMGDTICDAMISEFAKSAADAAQPKPAQSAAETAA